MFLGHLKKFKPFTEVDYYQQSDWVEQTKRLQTYPLLPFTSMKSGLPKATRLA